MDLSKLDVYLENLVPGLATVWAVSLMWTPPASEKDASTVVIGLGLLGAAYLTGVLVNTCCRLFLDPASEFITRFWVFRALSRDKLRDINGATRKQVNDAYNYYCTTAIAEGKSTSKEVAKRRQTARLVRSALIPTILVQLHFGIYYHLSWWLIALFWALEYLGLLLLYGYSEVTILHEAYHSVPVAERSVTVISRVLTARSKDEAQKMGTPPSEHTP